MSAQDMIKNKVFRWTIARKIGGLATVLICFTIIVIIYSIVSLNKIKKELEELASLDVPLIEISNAVEIYQLK